jgi:quinol monooxygenase YgiN
MQLSSFPNTLGSRPIYWLLVAFGLGAAASYLLRPPATIESSQSRRNKVERAFFLGVTITFPNKDDLEIFKRHFQSLATYVEKYEKGTLSYELLESDKDPLRIQILERYQDRDYYLNVHKTSGPFLKFRDELQHLVTKGAVITGESYLETDIGFI